MDLEKILASENRTMLTDQYQLTMGAVYVAAKKEELATFELFIRKLPEDWGYFVANGIEDAIEYLTNLHFTEDDITYLREQHIFSEEYLERLKEFKFTGDVAAVKEGTIVFPDEPLMQITAPRVEAQLVETMLLNTINFQTLIASKASRVITEAAPAKVVDFGLRRAQEKDAAMKGARAAYIAGAVGTSNVAAGKMYNIPIVGTHAHSFIMSFPTELEAFRAYVNVFPDNTTLLIDTYDTKQGARNAAIVAKELEQRGKRLGAVRIDSGDIAELSKDVRTILDEQGLSYVKIIATNDLNEYKIKRFKQAHAPINSYGVGTELITAKPVAALAGVYKLVEDNLGAKIKLSAEKKTWPGKKQVYRVYDDQGKFSYDALALAKEHYVGTPLLESVIKNGARCRKQATLQETRAYVLEQMQHLPVALKEVACTTTYHVLPSDELKATAESLTKTYARQDSKTTNVGVGL